ncbi:methyl-accepting chemotaxis protein [Pseudoalteromonas sp. G4]|uniref:methyl-accepting chemotaxis protein n=1 Tax=Pseudoalteromonas sp. G4 TaxID=2992761 RepID=UPI00237DE260|nr:methyl-accepting chemotaxis protein [Pseudoalteromonas sp. G4]MDE3273698.1 methyl-accepting chemotaxis protein [Pseudoalteromonas sp. G4]
MFQAIKIKTKLQILIGVAVVSMAALTLLNVYIAGKKQVLVDATEDLIATERAVADTLRIEVKFLEKPAPEFRQKLVNRVEDAKSALGKLQQKLATFDVNSNALADTQNALTSLQRDFTKLDELYIEYGYNQDAGLRKELRGAVHELEEQAKATNRLDVSVMVLQLRRSEKDFIMRGDRKYITRINNTVEKLEKLLLASNEVKLVGLLKRYQTSFLKASERYLAIGFNQSTGLKNDVAETEERLKQTLQLLGEELTVIQEDVYADAKVQQIALSLILAFSLVGFLFAIIRSITTSIDSVITDIDRIAHSGDLSIEVRKHGKDELAMLADSVNGLMSKFLSVLQTIQHSVEIVNTESTRVAQVVDSSGQQLVQQKSEVETVASAVTEMGAVAHDIATNAETTSNRVDTVSQNATIGQGQIEATVEQMTVLSNQLVESAEQVNLLREKSNAINAVMEVIRGIAEQTNLLALNAAIEAARAGEQGRGFAVVADEVRSLAVKTQESTQEITQIITDLQSSTANIVDSIELCKTQGLQTAEQTDKAGQAFAEIIADIQEISEMTSTIAVAVEQQSTVAQEINQNIVQISDYADELANSSVANSQASQQVSHQADELDNAIKWFKI